MVCLPTTKLLPPSSSVFHAPFVESLSKFPANDWQLITPRLLHSNLSSTATMEHVTSNKQQTYQQQWSPNAKQSVWDKVPIKKKSRRFAQRRGRTYAKHNVKKLQKPDSLNIAIQQTTARCLTNYGFYAKPEYNIQKNFNLCISQAQSSLCTQPTNFQFHNLCKENVFTSGTRQLLGLNLKFCISSNQSKNNINKIVLQMARSIRT